MGFSKEIMAANIRAARARADITQGDLAKSIGANIGTIASYENGSMVPGATNVYAMAESLGCTPNDLFGWEKHDGN